MVCYFGEFGCCLKVIGVIGINGKISIIWFLCDVFNVLGYVCGLIGILGVGLKGYEDSIGYIILDLIIL